MPNSDPLPQAVDAVPMQILLNQHCLEKCGTVTDCTLPAPWPSAPAVAAAPAQQKYTG